MILRSDATLAIPRAFLRGAAPVFEDTYSLSLLLAKLSPYVGKVRGCFEILLDVYDGKDEEDSGTHIRIE